MAVELPRVKRAGPVEPTSVGRVNMSAPDVLPAVAKQSQALEGLVEVGADYLNQQEKIAGDNIRLATENKFNERAMILLKGGVIKDEAGNETRFPGVMNAKDNPEEAYKQFDEHMIAYQKELLDKGADWSPRTKRMVTAGLANEFNKVYEKRLGYEGDQYHKWQVTETEARAKNLYNDVIDATTKINPEDEASFSPFDNAVGAIKQLRIREGIKNGSVQVLAADYKPGPDEKVTLFTDEDGTTHRVKISDSVKYAIAQDLNKSVPASIENMIDIGDVKSAKKLMEKYGDMMEPTKFQKLNKHLAEKEKKQVMYQQLDQIRNLPVAQREGALEKIEDPETKNKVRALLDADDRFKENQIKRVSDGHFNWLGNYIEKRMKSQPYANVTEMENDPLVEARLRFVNFKDQEVLRKLVKPPNASTPGAESKLWDAIVQNKFKNMPPDEFMKLKSDLGSHHRIVAEGAYQKANAETPGGERSRYNTMQVMLEQELQNSGFIKKKSDGKYSKEHARLRNDAHSYFAENFDATDVTMSVQEQRTMVKKFVTEYASEYNKKQGGRSFFDRILGTGNKVTPRPIIPPARQKKESPIEPPAGDNKGLYESLSDGNKQTVLKEWLKQNQGKVPTPADLEKYLTDKAKK